MSKSLIYSPGSPKLPDSPIRFALYFIVQYKWFLLGTIVFEAGQAACQILVPTAIRRLIDASMRVTGTFEEGLAQIQPDIQYFVLLSVGLLLFSRASGTIIVYVGPSMRRLIRDTVFHFLQHQSHRFFISTFAGSLSNRVSEVAAGVSHSMWTVLLDFWPVAITFSVSIYVLAGVSQSLAITLGAWVFVYVIVSFLLATRCRHFAKKYAETRSQVSGKIVDGVTNSLNTKLFARLDFERTYLSKYLDLEKVSARKTLWYMEAMRWFQTIATMILQVGIITFAMKLWLQKELTVGSFAMVASLALLIINDARGLSRRFLEFFEYLGNISDGVKVMITNHEVIDLADAVPINVSRGKIEFNNATFGYQGGMKVFENLNVNIQPGERVGLVGFSGSGKTTFTHLLLRMYDLQDGEIKVDDQNIAKVQQSSLREQISMIPQEPMLFHRSLMENIRYGKLDATDDEVIQAARLAKAHDFIVRLPEGYKSLVGERGVKLSGGQRQRIAIARAILKNAPILILDEATSSLDSVTEKAIQEALENLMKNKTVIVVAHRLSTIAHLNRILVFDNGKIIEDGSHEKLLKQDGHYALLWRMQAGGFLPSSKDVAE